MTTVECRLLDAYCDVIQAVWNVNHYVSADLATYVEALEAQIGVHRSDELHEIARRRMGVA